MALPTQNYQDPLSAQLGQLYSRQPTSPAVATPPGGQDPLSAQTAQLTSMQGTSPVAPPSGGMTPMTLGSPPPPGTADPSNPLGTTKFGVPAQPTGAPPYNPADPMNHHPFGVDTNPADIVAGGANLPGTGGGGGGSGGFGVDIPAGPQTAQTTGLQPGTPFMEGVDMTKQGAAEQYFSDFGSRYTAPTNAQNYANGVMQQYGNGNTPGVSNNAQDAFNTVSGANAGQSTRDALGQVQGTNLTGAQGALASVMGANPTGASGAYGQIGAYNPTGSSTAFGAVGGYNPTGASSALAGAQGTAAPGRVASVFQGGVGPVNDAENAYHEASGMTPANMDPYYQNASREAEERLRTTMAARGAYGSSATDDQSREMEMQLAADEAKSNAQYGLSRASTMGSLAQNADQTSLARSGLLGNLGNMADQATLQRLGLMGQLGSAADSSSLQKLGLLASTGSAMDAATAQKLGLLASTGANMDATTMQKLGLQASLGTTMDQNTLQKLGLTGQLATSADQQDANRLSQLIQAGSASDASSLNQSQNQMGWTKTLNDIMTGADNTNLNYTNSGMNAALGAQGAQTTRAQNAFNNQMTYGGALSGTMGQGYGSISQNDASTLAQLLSLYTGMGADAFGQATQAGARSSQNSADLINLLANIGKAGAGAGGRAP